MASYDIGNVVRATVTFTDPLDSDAAVDPAAVYAAVRDPSGAVTTYEYGVDSEAVKSATGVYYVDVTLTTSGRYHVRWYSTGTGQAAEETDLLCAAHAAS